MENLTAYDDIVHHYLTVGRERSQTFWAQVDAMTARRPALDRKVHAVNLAQIRAELLDMPADIRRERIPEIATEKYGYPADLFDHEWLSERTETVRRP
ncbi:hypothetical protein ACVDG8_002440 [Mesorhizobium sp. ORM8.1]